MVKVTDFPEEEYILPGTRLCAGCGLQLSYRWALKALGPNTIMTIPASCSVVTGGVGGYTPIKVPCVYDCFETAASSASGLSAGLQAKGNPDDITVVAWAGDGGTYDIGLQGLSGAAERGDDFIYVCYNNEAYMNTGIQRSGATPYGARTTTTPILGKMQIKKNMLKIMDAHGLSYIATCSVSHLPDLYEKFKKAKEMKGQGVRYIEILSSCPPGWGFKTSESIEMARLGVQTGYWPLFERIDGKLIISKPSKRYLDKSKRKDIRLYLKRQARFRSFKEEDFKIWEDYIEKLWIEIENELKLYGDL
ncbi:MAG: thiamine pyrophosphate-dependent enzyme [Promethearchaeota archaeon]